MPSQTLSRRITATLLIAGAVLGLIGNGLHPHVVATDAAAALRAIADSGSWVWIHVAIIVAVLLVAGGLVGFAQEMVDGAAAPVARLGIAAVLIGGALVFVSTSIDGFGRKALALNWMAAPAPQADAALQVGIGAKLVGDGVWTLGILIFFGAAFMCFGVAANLSRRFPMWVGWAAVLGGAGSVVAAFLRIASNADVQSADDVFLASSVLITLWALVLGIWVWRDVNAPHSVGAMDGRAVQT